MLRFSARSRKAAALPLTPIIDSVFQLLVYFLLTSSWAVDASFNVRLPEMKSRTTREEPEIVVLVDRGGRSFFREEP